MADNIKADFMVAAVRQQIVCCLSYNMYATGDFFYALIYFSLVKQERKTAFRAAAAPACCRAAIGFPEAALGGESFGRICFFPLPVVLSRSTKKEPNCVMELPSEQDNILFFSLNALQKDLREEGRS